MAKRQASETTQQRLVEAVAKRLPGRVSRMTGKRNEMRRRRGGDGGVIRFSSTPVPAAPIAPTITAAATQRGCARYSRNVPDEIGNGVVVWLGAIASI